MTSSGAWPSVSIIMPVVNEERHLASSVERLLAQDYEGELDICIAVGPSKDRTLEVAQALAAYPGVKEANVYGVAVPHAEGRAGMALLVVSDDFDIAGLSDHLDQAHLALQIEQQVQHLALNGDVKRADRLVAHDQLGLKCDGAGDADALALAAGKLERKTIGGVGGQADFGE